MNQSMRSPMLLTHLLRLHWTIDAIQLLSDGVVSEILHLLWCDIIMVVAPTAVVTEAVGVLHSKIQTLQ